jgi:hypothetical protein
METHGSNRLSTELAIKWFASGLQAAQALIVARHWARMRVEEVDFVEVERGTGTKHGQNRLYSYGRRP